MRKMIGVTCIKYHYNSDHLSCYYPLTSHDRSLESLVEIVHTKDGASIVRELLARGVAKDRRNILRVFKKHMQKVCEDAEAQTVVFTAFDVIE